MKEQYSFYLYFVLCIICATIISNESREKFAAVKNAATNNGFVVNVREIRNAKKPTQLTRKPSAPVTRRPVTGKPNAATTKKPIAAGVKGKQNTPSRQSIISKQNGNPSKKKSPVRTNAAFNGANFAAQNVMYTTLETSIIVGNQNTQEAEIYKLQFSCTDIGCTPNPVQLTDLLWFSPPTNSISEVKAVMYLGKSAVLATTYNGVIVYEYPSKSILFKKEYEPTMYCNIHSAEVLPDGSVITACSLDNGGFGILYPDGNDIQKNSTTQWINVAPFAHAVVYEKATNRVYGGAYLTIVIMKYEKGALSYVNKIPIDYYYDEPNKHENSSFEDGIHDIYPVDGDPNNLYVTTGEHAFLFNVQGQSLTRHPNLYTLPSQKSQQGNVAVKDKGGIKSISRNAKLDVVIAKPVPWFKEFLNDPYNEKGMVVIWSMPNVTDNNGFCYKPDYDLTYQCKIKFPVQLNKVYKVRVYQINAFSY